MAAGDHVMVARGMKGAPGRSPGLFVLVLRDAHRELSFERREHPAGDRVRVVLDGKFLPYRVY
ncbi:MAG: hypothetical protein WBF75_22625 [Pseudonocardiaceae bacterium]